jgi:hypothetical protein
MRRPAPRWCEPHTTPERYPGALSLGYPLASDTLLQLAKLGLAAHVHTTLAGSSSAIMLGHHWHASRSAGVRPPPGRRKPKKLALAIIERDMTADNNSPEYKAQFAAALDKLK